MQRIVLPLLLLLGACVPANLSDIPTRAMTNESSSSSLPPLKSFSSPRPLPPQRSNRDIARDFLDLAFNLESGRALHVFTRIEGPISIRVTGSVPPTLPSDLNRIIYRFRTEAGLNVALTDRDDAVITIQAVSRREILGTLPHAACFVVPNVSSLAEYKSNRTSPKTSWANLTDRRKLSVFIPNDSSPQEVRDCLHEELAQSIGPLNDLYRLPDSVFNDDNIHTVLTGFDMLVLKAYYSPELRNGMTLQEVSARIPGILARLNPAGENIAAKFTTKTPRPWIVEIQKALGLNSRNSERFASAQKALQMASALGWQDHRRAYSHYALGRVLMFSNPEEAMNQFTLADQFYRNVTGADIHRAYVAAMRASYMISRGNGAEASEIIAPAIPVAQRHENASLLATLMLLKAEALDLENRVAEARAVRLDSLGWARYGFGSEWAVRARMREISALTPFKR